MSQKIFIPIILGTNRQERESENVARFVFSQMEKHPEIETRLFDVRDFDLSRDAYGGSLKEKNSEYRDAIVGSDGLVVVSPEYNRGYPGVLKSALDVLLKEYVHKAVGLVGVSSGPWGGTRVIEALVPVMRELGLSPISIDLNFPKVGELFDDEGNIKDEAFHPRTEKFLKELLWMAKTLKWGRENVSSEFRQDQ